MNNSRRLIMGLVVAGVVLLLLEGGTRLLLPNIITQENQDSHMRPDELLGWSAVPGSGRPFGIPQETTINSLGTRNPEITEKSADEIRFLTLGDSTVFGVLVSDNAVFSSVAANYLSRKLRQPVTGINGGTPGYSSEQARRLLQYRLADVDVDFVVVATLWSDCQIGGVPDSMKFPERVSPMQRVLYNLGTYRFLSGIINGWTPTLVQWKLDAHAGLPRVPLRAYESNLNRIADLARERGAEPVFLILPSDRDLRGETLEPPRPEYREMMAQVASEQGALLVNGAEPFVGKQPQLMADDVHPSGGGHRLLGETLGAAMLAHIQGDATSP